MLCIGADDVRKKNFFSLEKLHEVRNSAPIHTIGADGVRKKKKIFFLEKLYEVRNSAPIYTIGADGVRKKIFFSKNYMK
jgi:hypothetical protein